MDLELARARIRERSELNAFISVSDQGGSGDAVAVKDLVDVKGMVTTAGAVILPGTPATDDAPVIRRLREAGCLIVGKANLHEFAYGVTSVNPHYGTVRNPHDPEPLFHMRNVSSEPVLPGAVPLSGVPEGLFNKNFIGGIRTIEPEPPPADQIADMMRRYVMFQAANFMVTGAAEFPKATEQAMHTEILMKARFFPILDATVTVIGVSGKSWTQPNIWVNRDLMLAVYLG